MAAHRRGHGKGRCISVRMSTLIFGSVACVWAGLLWYMSKAAPAGSGGLAQEEAAFLHDLSHVVNPGHLGLERPNAGSGSNNIISLAGQGGGAVRAGQMDDTGFGGTKVHTLAELPAAQVAKMTWLEKGRWLLDANAGLLQAARAAPFKSLTLVSVMVDLGRGKLGGGFKRSFSAYVNRMKSFLAYDFPKVVFLDADHLAEFQPLIDSSPGPVHVVPLTKDDIKGGFRHWDALQAVRTRKEWSNRKEWLSHSPQATLEYYNPLVMSKVALARQAAQLNPFNTDGFMFLDGGHLCNNPTGITRQGSEQAIIDRFMRDGMLVTYYDYVPDADDGEIHGFEAAAFHRYMGTEEEPIRVGRGGVFGGKPEFLAVAEQLVDVIAEETLGAGYLGTEENFLSLLFYRFREVVQWYDNGELGNCALFDDIVNPRAKASEWAFQLRGLNCHGDYAARAAKGEPSCFGQDGHACPAEVTPPFLKQADTQWSCHELDTYYCAVTCYGKVAWSANVCGKVDRRCRLQVDQLKAVPGPGPGDTGNSRPTGLEAAVDPTPSPLPLPSPAPAADAGGYGDQGPVDGVDLRGLHCAKREDGSPICFTDDPYDADYCPPEVTPDFLTEAKGQWACTVENPGSFCTAACTGDGQVKWTAHEKAWCAKNPDNCPPMPKRIPRAEFSLPPFKPPQVTPRQCRVAAGGTWASDPESFWFGSALSQVQRQKALEPPGGGLRGSAPEKVSAVTAVMLVMGKASELKVVKGTLDTYAARGLLSGVGEFLIWINGRTAEAEAALQPYVAAHGVKLLGSQDNVGQLRAINALFEAATNDYVLFLEKDFRMIEPWTCGAEQLKAGVALLADGTAHMVRYRHRWRAGKPNWALIMFRGKEERVFQQQPNLFCNHFHWIEHPEERWPDKIWLCHDAPYMYCSDSKYCNFTLNPFLVARKFWKKEYADKFDDWKQADPYQNLEYYMNWEPGSWNDRKWIVAQGEGLFRHEDFEKWG